MRMNKPVFCGECGANFAPWDEVFEWKDGRRLCGECFDAEVKELRREELADRLGCEVKYAEELKS